MLTMTEITSVILFTASVKKHKYHYRLYLEVSFYILNN